MNPKNRPRKLSVIIPSTTSCAIPAKETIINGGKPYSQLAHQPYRSPVSPPPLKHPYRLGINSRSEPAVKREEFSIKAEPHRLRAEDITSPNLLAVANLLSSMREALTCMTRAFDVLGEQSLRLSSLPHQVKLAEDIMSAKSELETQIAKQRIELQEVRRGLESEVRIALENNLRVRLMESIHKSVVKEVEDRVRQELAIQVPPQYLGQAEMSSGISADPIFQIHSENQSTLGTPLFSPKEILDSHSKILLFQEPVGEGSDSSFIQPTEEIKTEPSNVPVFSLQDYDSYPPVKIPILLFDESREHEPPPPSPMPMAGPLRPLLRPLPTPEQSPSYVVLNIPPSRPTSGCVTPLTAYPGVPAPTPITNEPVIMIFPMRNAPVSALSPVPESTSPLASRNLDILFALSSEENRELLSNYDLGGFVVPTPMSEWPRTRTILKVPDMSTQSSPLVVPPRLVNVASESRNAETPIAHPETPMLLVPPRHQNHMSNSSFSYNFKSLPPLIIS